jgi:hypothetical protein
MNSWTIIKTGERSASFPLNVESERGRLWWGESRKRWLINKSTHSSLDLCPSVLRTTRGLPYYTAALHIFYKPAQSSARKMWHNTASLYEKLTVIKLKLCKNEIWDFHGGQNVDPGLVGYGTT